jgi:hypothetical protein
VVVQKTFVSCDEKEAVSPNPEWKSTKEGNFCNPSICFNPTIVMMRCNLKAPSPILLTLTSLVL